MLENLNSQFTVGNFFMITLALLVLYFVLSFANRLLKSARFQKPWQTRVQLAIHYLLLVYEPLAIIILVSAFILINPLFDGLLIGLLLIAGFTHVRNYTSGWLILADSNMSVGKKLKTGNLQGIISKLGRLGLHLQTNEGIHYISYSKLQNQGYAMVAGEEIGGFYYLKISPNDDQKALNHSLRVMELLASAPYVDRNHKPELLPNKSNSCLEARVLLKEETHLYELLALIEEWGYKSAVLEPDFKR